MLFDKKRSILVLALLGWALCCVEGQALRRRKPLTALLKKAAGIQQETESASAVKKEDAERWNRVLGGIQEMSMCAACDDNNACTFDTCDENGVCTNRVVVECAEDESCDIIDGICKPNNLVRPVIAVIDESSTLRSGVVEGRWDAFRERFPDRPFCLLQPVPAGDILFVPPNFLNDANTIFATVNRDAGVEANLSDWFELCGLDRFTATGIDYVGFFIDTSGSMGEATVRASLDKFERDLEAAGLEFRSVFNANENWIAPFEVDLESRTESSVGPDLDPDVELDVEPPADETPVELDVVPDVEPPIDAEPPVAEPPVDSEPDVEPPS